MLNMDNFNALSNIEEDEDTMKGKYLTFLIDGEQYAISIKYVTEIVGMQPITNMPEISYHIKGIMNLRGKIIPVMDVRLRFGKMEKEHDEKTCIIVVDLQAVSVGLIVDEVCEVTEIPDEMISDPPAIASSDGKYVSGIGKKDDKINLIIDCRKLLSMHELEAFANF